MKHILRLMVVISLIITGLSSSAEAQTLKKNMKDSALGQFCPVAYAGMNKAVKGEAKYASTYKGKTYYSSSADAKKMFDADPAKYLPKYDGYCATAAAMGQKMKSDPEIFTEYKGSLYLFSSADAKQMFEKDADAIIEKADKAFAAK